jgi:asparagine synthase (glutamine-hydrolysing)
MCGINGAFAYHYAAGPIDARELLVTRDRMAARGPDGEGLWISPDRRVSFGHRRLAVIDLTGSGAQPMQSADGRFVVSFNGEIYNYRQLRRELAARGYVFRGQSDTETLLALYAQDGPDMVKRLRGMFAFALWDAPARRLMLARDPYGLKPLYYADDGWTLRFASQTKALIAGGGVACDADPAGEVGFYLFGHVPEPFTLHRAISALPAGATLLVDRLGAQAPRRYHAIAEVYAEAEATARPIDPREARARLREALVDSVRHHLVADVAVGAFLSSGADSSSLVGLMRDAGAAEIETVTLGFAEFAGDAADEAPLAAEVAATYGARHTVRRVSEAEFRADLPALLAAMDLPSIDGVNTWFVAKAARELGLKVAVSGLGGDELFAGYPSFRDVPRWVGMLGLPSLAPLVGRLSRRAAEPFLEAFGANPKAAGMLEYGGDYAGAYLLKRALFMPWELARALPRETVQAGLERLAPLDLVRRALTPSPRGAAAKVATLEASLYLRSRLLRDTDWASMAHGVEVRAPLVDSVLLGVVAQTLATAPQCVDKQALIDAPSRALPEAVRLRPKTGFATPLADWQHRALAPPARPARPREPWARAWADRVLQAGAWGASAA